MFIKTSAHFEQNERPFYLKQAFIFGKGIIPFQTSDS
jgi:hypothetical protein